MTVLSHVKNEKGKRIKEKYENRVTKIFHLSFLLFHLNKAVEDARDPVEFLGYVSRFVVVIGKGGSYAGNEIYDGINVIQPAPPPQSMSFVDMMVFVILLFDYVNA